jgi:hypothetical protein
VSILYFGIYDSILIGTKINLFFLVIEGPGNESSYAPFPKAPFLPFLLIDGRHVAK